VAAPATPERAAGAGTAAAATPARPPATPLLAAVAGRRATLPPWLPLPFAASATPASSHQWPSAPAPWSPWEGGAARLPAALARGSGRAQAGSTRSATPQAAHLQ